MMGLKAESSEGPFGPRGLAPMSMWLVDVPSVQP